MEYLIILLVVPIIPALIFVFLTHRIINWRALIVAVFTIFILGTIADYIGISRSIWNFTAGGDKTLGIQFFGIPMEDFLLAIFVPIWTICLYEFLKNRPQKSA